eukprot:s2686_g11.t1
MKGKQTGTSLQKKTIESDSEEQESDAGSFFGSEAEVLQDGEDIGEVLSPFGPETFASAELCWAHAESAHGFSLKALRRRVGRKWSDYHRIRLVNHLRKLGPEAACRDAPATAMLTAESPIWEREDLLMPVLADDLLLFDAVEESESESGESQAHEKGKGGNSPMPVSTSETEVHRMRAELESLRRLMSSTDDGVARVVTSSDMCWQTSRALRTGAEALQEWLSYQRELVAGRQILNLGCGANVLGLVCAQLGAQTVAVDACVENLALAQCLAEANVPAQGTQIQLMRGDLQDQASHASLSEGLACDGLLCERLLVRPSLANLLQVLAARQRYLHHDGWMFPRSASMHLSGCDFSRELEEEKALHDVLGLNLAYLAPRAARAGSVAVLCGHLEEDRIASEEPYLLLRADLCTAQAEDIFARRPFRIAIRPAGSLTSLMLELRLDEAGKDAPHIHTVLHLTESDQSLLCLRGRDFSTVEGYVSGALDGVKLQLAVALTAIPRSGDSSKCKCLSANFELPSVE